MHEDRDVRLLREELYDLKQRISRDDSEDSDHYRKYHHRDSPEYRGTECIGCVHSENELRRQLGEPFHEIEKKLDRIEKQLALITQLVEPKPITPTAITFQEKMMLDPIAGNTLVYTGTLAPSGSLYPAGTTFTVTSSDPTVTPTVDATGLIVTIPLPSTFVDDPAAPFAVTYTTSTFVPSPSTAPASLTATITPTIPAPPVLTPTGITFAQTA